MTARVKLATALVAVAATSASCGSSHPAATATATTATATSGTPTGATPTGAGSSAVAAESASPATPTTTEAPEATTTVRLQVPAGQDTSPFSTSHTLTVPAGWTAEVWARVPDARMEVWTPEGDLLVSVPSHGKIVELVPGATTGATPTQKTILSGLTEPQGLAFAHLDNQSVLYVGDSNRIDRYNWSDGVVGGPTVVAGNLPDKDPSGDDVHRQKDIAVSPDGTIYFNVGSSSNANPDDRSSSPPRAVIMAVDPDGTDLHVVETGVRNGEGLAVAPDGTVWTAVNNRDNVTYPFANGSGGSNLFGKVVRSYVNDHPSDEVVPVTQGRDLGWPYCNPDPDLSTPAGSQADVPFVADAVTNPNDKALNCATLPPIEVGIAAHSAPLGLSFLEGSRLPAPWSSGAVVAVHGSWDRQPPRAPAVLWMSWDAATKTLRPAVTLVGGFQNPDGSRWGRPVDAVAGPDGALFVSDDAAGAIYRLVPPGK